MAQKEIVELPKGWNQSQLKELFDFVIGGDWGKLPEYDDSEFLEVLCIRGSEFRNWSKDKGKTASLRKIKKASLTKRRLKDGDLLIEISGGGPEQPVGRTVLIDNEVLSFNNDLPKVCTNFLRLARPNNKINSKYLNYYLVNFYNSGEISKYQSGSNNLRNLKFKEYETINIPVAPLPEQKRIVEKLDSLLVQVDTIQQRLNNLPDIIKRFRQSVLAAAVSGKLTEQWREINEVNDWKTLTIGDISTFQNGFAFKSGWFADSGKYQVIKLGNVKDDYLKLEKSPAFINSDIAKEYIKYKPNVGDILISMTGTKYKGDYGYVCRVNEDLPILINQRVGRIVAKPDLIDSNFLLQYMRSELFRVEFLKGETGGVNQGNVGTKHIQSCPIGIPSLKEQTEIVRLVEQYFALAGTLEKNLANAKQRVDSLTQSILAKAFRGELVPQDPNDEPADKLLARIKAARLEAEKLEKAAKKAAKASKK